MASDYTVENMIIQIVSRYDGFTKAPLSIALYPYAETLVEPGMMMSMITVMRHLIENKEWEYCKILIAALSRIAYLTRSKLIMLLIDSKDHLTFLDWCRHCPYPELSKITEDALSSVLDETINSINNTAASASASAPAAPSLLLH